MLCVSLKYNYCQRMCHLNKDRCRVDGSEKHGDGRVRVSN